MLRRTFSLSMKASLSYSTMTDWLSTASIEASLAADTSVGTVVANLELIAADEDIFDDKPRKRDIWHREFIQYWNWFANLTLDAFFFCNSHSSLWLWRMWLHHPYKTSIQALAFSDELNSIVDTHLDWIKLNLMHHRKFHLFLGGRDTSCGIWQSRCEDE